MRQLIQQWNQIKAQLEVVEVGVGQTGLTPTCLIRRKSDGHFYQGGSGWSATVTPLTMTPVDATNFPGLYEYVVSTGHLDASQAGEGYTIKLMETTYSVLEYVDVKEVPSTNGVAQSVWGAARSSFDGAGTFGEGTRTQTVNSGAVSSASFAAGAVNAAAIASEAITAAKIADNALHGGAVATSAAEKVSDSVWDEPKSGHVASGSMGRLFQVIAGMAQLNHRLKNPTYDSEGRLLTATLVAYGSGSDANADASPLATVTVTATYDGDGNMLTLLAKE